jgi:hypothetical protein
MTEADEVAASLIPAWFKSEQMDLPGWVREQLKEESETVISNVIESLNQELLVYREDGKLKHAWITGEQAGFKVTSMLYKLQMCKVCGVLKGSDKYPESPCKDRVRAITR